LATMAGAWWRPVLGCGVGLGWGLGFLVMKIRLMPWGWCLGWGLAMTPRLMRVGQGHMGGARAGAGAIIGEGGRFLEAGAWVRLQAWAEEVVVPAVLFARPPGPPALPTHHLMATHPPHARSSPRWTRTPPRKTAR
jgi:hypothetical protein